MNTQGARRGNGPGNVFQRVAVGQGAARALRLIQKRGIKLWLMKTINNRLLRCCHPAVL
jgi:hypothetical protein